MAGRDHPPAVSPAVSGERARLRILESLRRSPRGLTVQDLADGLGLHVNTVRFHLDRLLETGQVARSAQPRDRPGRPQLIFTARPGPHLHGAQRDYRLLADLLTGLVAELGADAAPRATAVGRRWGAAMTRAAAVERPVDEVGARAELLRILGDVGFAPEVGPDDDRRVLLRHCPFLEAAAAHPDVVCSVHRGLMDGALAEMDAPLVTERLIPFAEPAGCVAQLVSG